jgi:hydroxymethylpyrimidine pyrophosphatase-like HAD family hydrolase
MVTKMHLVESAVPIRRLALCCDYDGTIASAGIVHDATLQALERVRASGRRLLLVTGRELDDLRRVFPRIDLFDRIVAENGGLLFCPDSGEERLLGAAPPQTLVAHLLERGVKPLSVGRCVLATWEPQDVAVLTAIRQLGLELQVVFNKGAVMVLPPGVNKASGLAAALESLDLSPHNAVAIGDAENDHSFLAACGVGVAVSNALPALKEQADFVTSRDHGAGVVELIDELLADDLTARCAHMSRHRLALGVDDQGQTVALDANHSVVLITGLSGSGKSTVAKTWLAHAREAHYSFCVIDPEGDYLDLPGAVVIGTHDHPAELDEVLRALESRHNVVVNLLGIRLDDRPALLAALMPRLSDLRQRTGRPHVLVIDEAHHMLGAELPGSSRRARSPLDRTMLITVHPDLIAPDLLRDVTALVVVGSQARVGLVQFAQASGLPLRWPDCPEDLEAGQAIVWLAEDRSQPVRRVALHRSQTEHRRHNRKYAEGELPEDRSFYFRGPEGRLNLRAQNLWIFLQIADGIDDETWLHHLRRGDYTTWFHRDIKDEELARVGREIEGVEDPAEGRRAMRQAIERLYTLPA